MSARTNRLLADKALAQAIKDNRPTIAMARTFMRRINARYPDARSVTTVDEIGEARERVGSVQIMFDNDTVESTLFMLSLGDGAPPRIDTHGGNVHVKGQTKGGLAFVTLIPDDLWPDVKAALAGGALAKAFGT